MGVPMPSLFADCLIQLFVRIFPFYSVMGLAVGLLNILRRICKFKNLSKSGPVAGTAKVEVNEW